jgi:hypothetical protein
MKWIKILVLKIVDMIKFALDVQNSARLVRVNIPTNQLTT